jgi:hypothetical protein
MGGDFSPITQRSSCQVNGATVRCLDTTRSPTRTQDSLQALSLSRFPGSAFLVLAMPPWLCYSPGVCSLPSASRLPFSLAPVFPSAWLQSSLQPGSSLLDHWLWSLGLPRHHHGHFPVLLWTHIQARTLETISQPHTGTWAPMSARGDLRCFSFS